MIHHKSTWLGAIGVVALLPSVTLADVSGKVFRDFNANGVFDSNEVGVANVTAKAFDPSGAQAATAVSAADGTYALTLATGTDYRVEFTWGEDWLQPAAAGGTSVQFVKNGASSINFALHNPAQTVAPGAIPSIVTAVHSGSVHYGTEFVLTKIPESAGSTSSTSMNAYMTPAPTVLAQEQEIGAIWGVAHDRSRQRLLAAAFVKRFARLAGNPTTIYSVPENAGTPAPWITLDVSRADPHGASPDWSKDFDVIPSVGKEGLGDVDIAEDSKTVYTIDLQTRELVLIPVNTDGSAGTPRRVALPTTLANCTDSNDIRPMGLGVRDGKVFVGSVCSGESTVSGLPIASTAARKGDPSKLRGYVHVWDGATTFAPVADFALNYQRGCLNSGGMGNCGTYGNAAWQAWTPTYPFSDWSGHGNGYPQPLISDIEFTPKGDMVLGLADRFGHMDGGYAAEPPSGSFNSGQLTIAGDTLHACKTGENTWVMEKLISGDASCSTAGKGYDANKQPTLDEYYFEDDMGLIIPGNHADVGDGGIGIVLENSAIISTVMDPARNAPWSSDGKDPWESHGLHWYDGNTGGFTKGYVLFDQGQPGDQPIWGKGNGLGDVEVLYPPAPVEIGNRVWLDTNSDGIQGADEAGIDGVEVKLVCGSDQALMTTANGGQFLFSNAQGGNAPFMEYGESCTLTVDGAQTSVKDYSLTTPNADSVTDNNPLTDLRDSDAANNAGVAEIAVTLGNAGENNHTLDIGYKNTPVITFDPPPGPDAFSCAANVRLAASVQVNGDSQAAGSTGASVDGLITFDYAATGELAAPFSKATAGQVGAVWGLAYDDARKKLYASAFLKRHASFGPNGVGAIYQMDGTSATPTPSLLMDLAAKGVDVGTSPRVAASGVMDDPNELPIDASKPSWDRDAFAQVGKISLGDIDISADGNTLWAVNLKQRELVEIDLTNTTVKATHAITDPGCSNGEFRPWAVKAHDGNVWVGTVCSAETSQQAADLKAYVQAFDGTTFTTATSFALNYSKGSIGNGPGDEKWQPWKDTFTTLASGDFAIYPQPILSDIEFDMDGSLILGFMDRMGHQVGGVNYTPNYPDDDTMIQGQTGGDIIRVCNNGGKYELENNATCTSGSTAGKDKGQGPGNGEYYWGEMWDFNPFNADGGYHQETSFGGLAFKAGSGEIAVTAMNPLNPNANAGGVIWLDNATGGRAANAGVQVYRQQDGTSPYFGKASGMGDVELFCAEAVLQPDLSLTKVVDKPTAKRGETVIYTLTLSNTGTGAATGVSVTDPLPAGVEYVSDDGSGAYVTSTGVWSAGSLAANTTKTLKITVTVK